MRFTREGLLTAVLVVAALFVGSAVTPLIPAPESVRNQPFEHAVALGEPATLRTGVVTVTQVRTAAQVSHYSQVAATTGVFVVIDLVWEARGEPHILDTLGLRLVTPDGTRYGGYGPVGTVCLPAQPGLSLTCQLAIEAQPDAVRGASLVVPAGGNGDNDDVAVVDLRIDEERAAALATPEELITLAPPTVRGRP